jgi:hypothetical protein
MASSRTTSPTRESAASARVSLEQQAERLTDAYLANVLQLEEYKRRRLELDQRLSVTGEEVEIRYAIPTSPKGETIRFCHLRLDYFNAPMTTNRGGKAMHIAAKAEQVIARFVLHLLTNTPFGLHHANGLQALPFALFIQITQLFQVVNDPILANFQPPLRLLNALLKLRGDVAKLLLLGQTKGIFDILI